jgi:hypothetical protein
MLFDEPAPPRKPAIGKIRYTHDAMIEIIISQPGISQGEIAREFGYSETWVSIIINSDAFQERLRVRKAELTDPLIRATIEERLEGLAKRSLDKLIERLDTGAGLRTPDLIAMAKLGVGDRANRPATPTQQNNLYVVALPAPAQTSSDWLATRSLAPPQPIETIDLPQKAA